MREMMPSGFLPMGEGYPQLPPKHIHVSDIAHILIELGAEGYTSLVTTVTGETIDATKPILVMHHEALYYLKIPNANTHVGDSISVIEAACAKLVSWLVDDAPLPVVVPDYELIQLKLAGEASETITCCLVSPVEHYKPLGFDPENEDQDPDGYDFSAHSKLPKHQHKRDFLLQPAFAQALAALFIVGYEDLHPGNLGVVNRDTVFDERYIGLPIALIDFDRVVLDFLLRRGLLSDSLDADYLNRSIACYKIQNFSLEDFPFISHQETFAFPNNWIDTFCSGFDTYLKKPELKGIRKDYVDAAKTVFRKFTCLEDDLRMKMLAGTLSCEQADLMEDFVKYMQKRSIEIQRYLENEAHEDLHESRTPLIQFGVNEFFSFTFFASNARGCEELKEIDAPRELQKKSMVASVG